ncbi:MAG: UDP-diphosphatase, partial [Candidatus Portnoybacteria bacterium CG10_big_fil_rev_8_21_14_0_10_44_7]
MLSIWHAIILGIVQGITEFLPISSSAHLILWPWFFGWPDPGLSFDVALHTGTLIAVVLFFWREWLGLFSGFGQMLRGSRPWRENREARLLTFLAIATIPGALFGYFLEGPAESVFRSPLLIALTMAGFGLILWWGDRVGQKNIHTKQVSLKQSILIGLSQALAVIPGVSRSGSTITAGLFLGLRKESAAKFSFLLSAPIILGASALKVPHLFNEGLNPALFWGIFSAAVSG